jgi:hypothetical protein
VHNRTPAAGRDAVDLRDGRDRHALEPIDDCVQPALVGDPVGARGELGELADIGAGGEGVAIGPHHEHTNGIIIIDAVAGRDERVVHRPGQGVARGGTVEGQERDRAGGFELRLRSGHGCNLTGVER